MKILLTADWHLKHKHKYTSIVEGKVWDKFFEEKMSVLKQIPKIADEYKVDHVVVAGDVFDTTNPPEAIKTEFCKLLEDFNVPVYIIPGNHESSSLNNHALMDIGQAFMGKRTGRSHVFIGDYYNGGGIGVFHLMMEGIDTRYKKVVKYDDERFKPYNTILLGDYHSYYKKKYADKWFVYPGAPYPTRFGESNHSVLILQTSDDGNLQKLKKVDLDSYELMERNIHYQESMEFDIEDMFQELSSKFVLKFNVVASQEHFKRAIAVCQELKNNKYLVKKGMLDFVYNIKTESQEASKEEVGEKSVEDIAYNFIENNSPYPKETAEEFKKILGGVR